MHTTLSSHGTMHTTLQLCTRFSSDIFPFHSSEYGTTEIWCLSWMRPALQREQSSCCVHRHSYLLVEIWYSTSPTVWRFLLKTMKRIAMLLQAQRSLFSCKHKQVCSCKQKVTANSGLNAAWCFHLPLSIYLSIYPSVHLSVNQAL